MIEKNELNEKNALSNKVEKKFDLPKNEMEVKNAFNESGIDTENLKGIETLEPQLEDFNKHVAEMDQLESKFKLSPEKVNTEDFKLFETAKNFIVKLAENFKNLLVKGLNVLAPHIRSFALVLVDVLDQVADLAKLFKNVLSDNIDNLTSLDGIVKTISDLKNGIAEHFSGNLEANKIERA